MWPYPSHLDRCWRRRSCDVAIGLRKGPHHHTPGFEVAFDQHTDVVARPSDEPPEFLDSSPAGHFKGKYPTVPVAVLRGLWAPGTRIVYIGKANAGANGRRGLRKRLDEFRRHGAGEPVGHSGGRRIWQLADSHALMVGWRTTDETTAVATETQMIAQFRAHHGRLPFANMRG